MFKQLQLPIYQNIQNSIVELGRQGSLDKLDKNGQEKVIFRAVLVIRYTLVAKAFGFAKINWIDLFYASLTLLNFGVANVFTEGTFKNLGSDWLAFLTNQSLTDPLISAFPSQSTCFYPNLVSNQTESVSCFLHANSYNSYVFLFIWFWYYFGAFIFGWFLLERIVYQFRPYWRLWHMERIAPIVRKEPFLQDVILYDVQSWHALFLISKNMKAKDFETLLKWLVEDAHFHCVIVKQDIGPTIQLFTLRMFKRVFFNKHDLMDDRDLVMIDTYGPIPV